MNYCLFGKEDAVMSFIVDYQNAHADASAYNCLGFILGKTEVIGLKKEKASDSLVDVFKKCLAKNYIRATQKKTWEPERATFVLFNLTTFYDLAFHFHVIRVNFDGTVDNKPDNKPAESFANLEEFAAKYPEYNLDTAMYFVLD